MRPATSRINRFVSSLTGPLAFRTLETVATDIFASRATSLIVTILLATVDPASDHNLSEVGWTGGQLSCWSIFALQPQICNRLHRGRQTPPTNRAGSARTITFAVACPSPILLSR